jgi:hypothetical protein
MTDQCTGMCRIDLCSTPPQVHTSVIASMKIYLALLSLSITTIAQAEPFSYLTKELVDSIRSTSLNIEMYIHYNPKLYRKIGKKREEFPKSHPFYTDEYGNDNIVLGVFDLTGKSDNYYITYDSGASVDVNYCFNKEATVLKAIDKKERYLECDFEISALSIIIPGNGSVYTYGHNNTMYDIRSKYTLKNDKLELVPQPFSYIGKKTKSLKNQVVYTDEKLETESYRITKGYDVTVVGFKQAPENHAGIWGLYLVASKFGLLGWVPSDGQQVQSQFEGFYFNGD